MEKNFLNIFGFVEVISAIGRDRSYSIIENYHYIFGHEYLESVEYRISTKPYFYLLSSSQNQLYSHINKSFITVFRNQKLD